MKHKNSDKQFLKVPLDFSHVKKGKKVGISFENRGIYLAYLFAKSHSRFGRVHKKHLPKRHFGYWLTKLVSVGFITVEGDYYLITSYEAVWSLLGIIKFKSGKTVKYKFYKVKNYTTWTEFKKKNTFEIQATQTERKLRQMRHRTAKGNVISSLSAQAVANLLGYKSAYTGSKYRNKFFDVIEEPLVLRMGKTSDLLPYFYYQCKKVHLKPIFHECEGNGSF